MSRFILKIYRRIFARKIFKEFNSKLFQLSLRGLGILNYENDQVSGEEFIIKKILPRLINSERPTLLDIGANHGDYSRYLHKHFPEAHIYAFEPHPKSYSLMKEKLSSDNIRIFNIALGKEQGKLSLYDRSDVSGSEHATLFREVISELHKQTVVEFEVNVETLDSFAEKERLEIIHFMKIDTEGNELSVLQGASKLLAGGNIKCIQFEFNEMNIVSRVFFRDIRKVLQNYQLYRLLPTSLLPLNENPLETELFGYQNILAISKNITIDE